MGNVQTAGGNQLYTDVEMYDGTMFEGVETRVNRMLGEMDRRKGNCPGGAYRAVMSVVVPMILYPAVFSSLPYASLEKMQNRIDKTLRSKFKLTQGVAYDLLHTHEELGGMGLDRLRNIIGDRQVHMIKKGLNSEGAFGHVMKEAVNRLRHQAGTELNPLEHKVMDQVSNDGQFWINSVKTWMESYEIDITGCALQPRDEEKNTTEDVFVMDLVKQKGHRRIIGPWLRKSNVQTISDMITPEGEWRGWLAQGVEWETLKNIAEVGKKIRGRGKWVRNVQCAIQSTPKRTTDNERYREQHGK